MNQSKREHSTSELSTLRHCDVKKELESHRNSLDNWFGTVIQESEIDLLCACIQFVNVCKQQSDILSNLYTKY